MMKEMKYENRKLTDKEKEDFIILTNDLIEMDPLLKRTKKNIMGAAYTMMFGESCINFSNSANDSLSAPNKSSIISILPARSTN